MQNQKDLKKIREFLHDGDGPVHYHGQCLPLDIINVLPQPRRTFEDIEELALDVAKKGLLNPITVAAFNSATCSEFLKIINVLWDANYRLEDLRPVKLNGEKVFYILLAGERRFRAFNMLWEMGCIECQEKYGHEPEGKCLKRHFDDKNIEVRLCDNIPPLNALYLQLSENTHVRVPAHEEAKAYSQLFKLVKQADPNVSVAWFARQVGRSASTIRNALNFCELPSSIQTATEKGKVPYGIALELSLLYGKGVKGDELKWWLMRGIVENKSIPNFRKIVRDYLETITSGQSSLLDFFSDEEKRQARRMHIKQAVATEIIKSLWAFIGYWSKVFRLFEEGRLGKEDSPLSERSPARLFRRQVELMELQILPHIQSFLPRKKILEIKRVLQETKIALKNLDTQ
ncbi:MAG: hypothetical protein HY764_03720 [Candidatus Portnoybacteria bacterium]|nr:hypothetical protein [Candidatus Portnoybacteria bacterium]